MSERPAIDQATRMLRAQLTTSAPDGAAAEAAWAAFTRFGRTRFNAPDSPDADGLLFQYGVFGFDGPPAFILSLTRQFAVLDTDGEHDHFVHVCCELTFDPVPALADLGSFDSWFFYDAGDDLDRWFGEVTSHDAWDVIRRHQPRRIEVSEEAV